MWCVSDSTLTVNEGCSVLIKSPIWATLLSNVMLSNMLPLQDPCEVWRGWGVVGRSMSCIGVRGPSAVLLWEGVLALILCCCCWTVAPEGPNDGSSGPLGWLLSDKGPFHHSLEFTETVERHRQGFTTRYKIYRWDVQCHVSVCGSLSCLFLSPLKAS